MLPEKSYPPNKIAPAPSGFFGACPGKAGRRNSVSGVPLFRWGAQTKGEGDASIIPCRYSSGRWVLKEIVGIYIYIYFLLGGKKKGGSVGPLLSLPRRREISLSTLDARVMRFAWAKNIRTAVKERTIIIDFLYSTLFEVAIWDAGIISSRNCWKSATSADCCIYSVANLKPSNFETSEYDSECWVNKQ